MRLTVVSNLVLLNYYYECFNILIGSAVFPSKDKRHGKSYTVTTHERAFATQHKRYHKNTVIFLPMCLSFEIIYTIYLVNHKILD